MPRNPTAHSTHCQVERDADRDRDNRRGNGGRRRNEDRRRDYDDGNNGCVPPVPGQPDIVPVPENDVGVALNRIRDLTSAMRPLVDSLDNECTRWLGWIEWRNRNCVNVISSLVQEWCNDAADHLSDLTDMQNDLVEMKADCRRQEEIVERAGRRVPYATDMINSLDNRCMSQVVDGEVVTLPESQPRREGNNDRNNNNCNNDNRDNNDRKRGRSNNRDNDRHGGSQRRGSRY